MEQHTKSAMRNEMIRTVRDLPPCPDGRGGPCPSCMSGAAADIAERYVDAASVEGQDS